GVWLIASSFALIIPIFVPSFPGTALNPISTSLTTMFILSFPSSLVGLPLLYLVNYMVGVDPGAIQGMYENVIVLYVLGLVQWFWLVPRLWSRKPPIQMLDLVQATENAALSEGVVIPAEFFNTKETSPLERVMRDSDDQ
ncbi:MAG TPA: hypothetical protein VJL58_08405, partial [Pyrinomonadaceae bacterium]|nr:hypothetical protein [Pyrinomonadaceae bacterium]